MFDAIVKSVAAHLEPGERAPQFVRTVASFVTDPATGGVTGFLERFRAAGLADLAASWLGKPGGGGVIPSVAQIESLFKDTLLPRLLSDTGIAQPQAAGALRFLLPDLIGKLTPGGVVPGELPADLSAALAQGSAPTPAASSGVLGAAAGAVGLAAGAMSLAASTADAAREGVTTAANAVQGAASGVVAAAAGTVGAAADGAAALGQGAASAVKGAAGATVQAASAVGGAVSGAVGGAAAGAAGLAGEAAEAGGSLVKKLLPWLLLGALLLIVLKMCGGGQEPAAPAVVPAATAPAAPEAAASVPGAAPAAVPAAVPEATSAAGAAPASATLPALPAVKLHFAVGATVLSADATATLQPIVDYLKTHDRAKARISGFHDPSGDKASNEALAKDRAKVVAAALAAAGIATERIELAKPAETEGTGDKAEARRVEVSIQP